MDGRSDLDALERYLADAAVLDVAVFPTSTPHAHPAYRVLLEGAVAVIAKPADTIPEGETLVRREVAAWVVACELGWTDLIAGTVLRSLPSVAAGHDVDVSSQVIWPDCLPDAPPEHFPVVDTWRAGVFDAVIGQLDRGGHNWLAVPAASSTGDPPRVKLIDHGYAFDEVVRSPVSTFFELFRGQPIPDPYVRAMTAFLQRLPDSRVPDLLTPGGVAALEERTRRLVRSGVLQLP